MNTRRGARPDPAPNRARSAPVALAVHALTDPNPSPEVFEVTGSELLRVPEQVAILAKALGKQIKSVDVPAESAAQGLIRAGLPAPVAAAVAQSFAAIRDGRMAMVKDTVKQVTGKQPAQEHASRFA
ncbi:MAG: hypothetical protein ABSC65_12535 [Acidobacteriaceae bacterium]|jgi:uncharacterized protein YbjT (DUF2867 family)